MSKPSWIETLHQKLHRLQVADLRPRVAIVGLGHELRGDDAAGLVVTRMLKDQLGGLCEWPDEPHRPALLIVEAGSAPENVTGCLRSFRPNLVILVDAADFRDMPGMVRWLDWQDTTGLSASTHSLPVQMLARYLIHEFAAEVSVLGIQPAADSLGLPLSVLVLRSVERIASELEETLTGTGTAEAQTSAQPA